MNLVTSIDQAADGFADNFRGKPIFDKAFYYLSHFAEFSILWQVIALVALLPFESLRDQWVRLLVALLAESVIVNQIIKRLTNRARPAPSDKLTTSPRRPSTTSLPSGHASSATLGAILLAIARPALAVPLIFLAALVAYSRLHNRVHHATDILAGIPTGLIFVALATWIA